MTTLHQILSAVALTSVVVTSGCLHHPQLLDCVPGAGENQCWQSSRTDDAGHLRHHVVERVTPGDRCDMLAVEQSSFDERGALVARVIEERRCRVIERRITDSYDFVAGTIERTVEIDLDHDDRFDTVRTLELPMTADDRVFALTTSVERFASLAEARDRASWKTWKQPRHTPTPDRRGVMAKQ
jgi:hypothetical protein